MKEEKLTQREDQHPKRRRSYKHDEIKKKVKKTKAKIYILHLFYKLKFMYKIQTVNMSKTTSNEYNA